MQAKVARWHSSNALFVSAGVAVLVELGSKAVVQSRY